MFSTFYQSLTSRCSKFSASIPFRSPRRSLTSSIFHQHRRRMPVKKRKKKNNDAKERKPTSQNLINRIFNIIAQRGNCVYFYVLVRLLSQSFVRFNCKHFVFDHKIWLSLLFFFGYKIPTNLKAAYFDEGKQISHLDVSSTFR